MKPETNIGPVTTEPQYKKIREYIEIGRKEGAEVLFGGGTPQGPEILGTQFVEPTIAEAPEDSWNLFHQLMESL